VITTIIWAVRLAEVSSPSRYGTLTVTTHLRIRIWYTRAVAVAGRVRVITGEHAIGSAAGTMPIGATNGVFAKVDRIPATAQGLGASAVSLAGQFTDENYCASPSGSFVE